MDFPKVDLAQFLPAGAGQQAIDPKNLGDPFSSFEGEVERDVVKVSAQARQLAAGAEDSDDVEDVGGSLLGSAKGLIHSALNSISKDLSHVLKAFGFDSDIAKEFAKAFVQPVIDALKEGIDFSAKLTLAAFSQETVISGSEISQKTQLIAKSIEIEVNNSTGEVSVAVASLSVEENIHVDFGAGLFDGPLFPADDPAAEAPVDDVPATEAPAEAAPVEAENVETAPGAAVASSGTVAASIFVKEAVEALVAEQVTLESRITLRAFEQFNNEDGELISKFRFEAAVSLTAQLERTDAGGHHGHDDDDDHQNTIAITA